MSPKTIKIKQLVNMVYTDSLPDEWVIRMIKFGEKKSSKKTDWWTLEGSRNKTCLESWGKFPDKTLQEKRDLQIKKGISRGLKRLAHGYVYEDPQVNVPKIRMILSDTSFKPITFDHFVSIAAKLGFERIPISFSQILGKESEFNQWSQYDTKCLYVDDGGDVWALMRSKKKHYIGKLKMNLKKEGLHG